MPFHCDIIALREKNMSVSQKIGRAVIAKGPQDFAENVSEYLTCSGVEALICYEDECYLVTVNYEDEEKARRLYEEKFSDCTPCANRRAGSFSGTMKKLGEINDSAFFFVLCGGAVFVIAALRLLNVLKIRGNGSFLTVAELILGFFFLLFGFQIFYKSHQAKKTLAKENAFSLKVIGWFLGTYSSEDLDRMAEADKSDLSPSEQRRELIRKLINREFSIDDEEYLSYLSDEAYTAMYHTRKLAADPDKK